VLSHRAARLAAALTTAALAAVACTSGSTGPAASEVSPVAATGSASGSPSASVSATATASASGSASAAADPSVQQIQVSVSNCGQGFTATQAGPQNFRITDTDSRAGEVMLIDPTSLKSYGEVEPMGPGTAVDLQVVLGAGRYAFRCTMEDEDAVVGPTATLTGTATDPAPGVVPVTAQDLYPIALAYQKYVTSNLPTLAADTDRLLADLKRGDRVAAKRDWLTAHLVYEQLGAAYGAFGDADGAINGLPNGLPGGVDDKDFTGFHRVEHLLWGNGSAAELTDAGTALSAAVHDMQTAFPDARIDPLDIAIRAHEITENALQFELTAQADLGSHSGLATIKANLVGTVEVLKLLNPVLASRYPALPTVNAALQQAQTDVDSMDKNGTWTAVQALSRSDRERIDADLSSLSELLAPIAAICEPRRTS
jgi:iron uptake system component EfeO